MSSFVASALLSRPADVQAHELTLTSSSGNTALLGVIGGFLRGRNRFRRLRNATLYRLLLTGVLDTYSIDRKKYPSAHPPLV